MRPNKLDPRQRYIALRETSRELAERSSTDLIREAATQAVMDALAQVGEARIVVVNVNIQIASGGGATNQFVPNPRGGIYEAGNYRAGRP